MEADVRKKVIVLSANNYAINDKDTGKMNSGVSFTYLATDNLNPVTANTNTKGIKHSKASLPDTFKDVFVSVPAFYEMDFNIAPDKDGHAALKPVDARYIGVIKIMDAFAAATGKEAIPAGK